MDKTVMFVVNNLSWLWPTSMRIITQYNMIHSTQLAHMYKIAIYGWETNTLQGLCVTARGVATLGVVVLSVL